MKARPVLLFVQALALVAVLSPGYPLFKSWCGARLPGGAGGLLVAESAALALVILLVALFDRVAAPIEPRAAACLDARATPGAREALAQALLTLFALGLLALALRVADPLYDDRELRLRGLASARALGMFLLVLPFGVAAEEIIFRACQRRLRSMLAPVPCIAAVGLCFSAYHWAPGTPLDRQMTLSLLAALAGGLALAHAYERIGSVAWLIAIHLVYDALAVAQAWLDVARARLAEFALFAAWLALAGGIGSRLRRPGAVAGAPGGAKNLRTVSAGGPATNLLQWIAALGFGLLYPLLLAWIRIRSR
jgi:membrane protease YdiL (CAAX protease family)